MYRYMHSSTKCFALGVEQYFNSSILREADMIYNDPIRWQVEPKLGRLYRRDALQYQIGQYKNAESKTITMEKRLKKTVNQENEESNEQGIKMFSLLQNDFTRTWNPDYKPEQMIEGKWFPLPVPLKIPSLD